MNKLFDELRRRNVFRVGVTYAVVGWALIEVADTVFPRLALPDWSVTLVIVLVLLGLPLALFLAWAFELTPEGVVRTPDVEAAPSGLSVPGRRTSDLLIIGGLSLAVALLAWDRFSRPPETTGEASGTVDEAGDAPSTEAGASIAVLPFADMSPAGDQEYFADGLSEEILNLLAGVPGLKVTGRTSSFAFKDREVPIPEIGRALGVSHLLEGSVRTSGSRVRVTAQLVRADDGFHIWSETYDRELTDIFALQDEIGAAILDAMQGSLLGEVAADRVPTTDIDAYTRYLEAQALLARRGPENLRAARARFEAALALDPDYAPALVGLARTLSLLPSYARLSGATARDVIDEAVRLARRALEIDADDAHALAVLGTVYTFYEWRWAEAEEALTRALALAPNDAEIVNFTGDYFRVVLDPGRALELEGRALELDPLHPVQHWDLAWTNVALGDHESAIAFARSGNALDPTAFDPYHVMVVSYGALGRFEEMRAALESARENADYPVSEYLLLDTWAAIAEGRRDDALGLVARAEPFAEEGQYSGAYLGFQYLLLGESERAARWLERAYDDRDVQLAFQEPIDLWLVADDPVARSVLEHPELAELMELRTRNAREAGEIR